MRKRQLEHSLRAEIEWLIATLSRFGSPSSYNIEKVHAAMANNATFLHKYVTLLVDGARPYPEAPPEDLHRIGALLIALETRSQGRPWRLYQPDEFDTGQEQKKSAVVHIRCTETWKLKLRTYCERSGVDASTLIRAAVDAHLASNPLWQSYDGTFENAGAEDGEEE